MIKNISSNWFNNGNLLKLLCSKIKKNSQSEKYFMIRNLRKKLIIIFKLLILNFFFISLIPNQPIKFSILININCKEFNNL